MLDGSLSSAYSQYKEDTDSVAAWLASTARKCGYQPEQLSSAANAGPGRLKGKARKDAKRYQQAPQIVPSTPKHIIAIKDFIPLAEHIVASTKPMTKVPAAFATTIDRVIYLRSKFGEKMRKRGIETDKDSDESHNYFVGVLETVRSILRPRMPVETTESVSLEDLTNRFMGLGVEEPSQEFLDAPDPVRPEKAQGDDNNYEAELLKSFDDAFMACTALVNDLNDIRKNILAIWNALLGHDSGGLDPSIAAVTTNTAIDLARNLIEQVLPILEAQGDPCHVLESWACYQAQDAGFTEDEVSSWGKPGAGNEKMYTIADQCFLNANVLLRNFIDRIGNKDPTQLTLGVFEAYDPKSDRSKKDGHAKFEEDEQILGALLTEAMTLIHGVKDYPVEDEFLRGVSEMKQTGKRPLYLTFAAQVVLDIHACLREEAEHTCNYAGAQIDTMHADLHLQMEFNARVKPPGWPAENERTLRALEFKMGWVMEDPVFLVKRRRAEKSGVLVTESQRHQMLVLSPIVSGLLVFHFRAQMYEFSILVMNCLGSVAYSAHLYNALVKEEYLKEGSWPDLEFVQNTLGGKSNFFVGDPPTDTEGYNKRLLLQMGYSVSAISSKGLLKGNSKSRSGVRLIKGRSPVTSMFIDRYTRGSARVNFSPGDIDEIISRNQNEHREYARWSNQVNVSREDTEVIGKCNAVEPRESGDGPTKIAVYSHGGKRKKPTFPTRRKKATEGGKVRPDELLKPLSIALTGEIVEFASPFLYMHRMTWDVLAGIKAACDPILQRVDSPYLEREYSVPFVVAYIFGVLCKDPEGAGEELMCAAAEAFDKIITEKGGGDAVLKRFSRSNGMIIKSHEELYGESHRRYHDRNDMKPVEDCDWDCGWRHDWEIRVIKEKEDDKDSQI